MGAVHYCPVPFWPHNTTLYVTNFCGNVPRFVYYALKTIDFRRYNSGSAQASLNRNNLDNISIWCPSVEEQQTIAHILGALDDKIDLNQRMNETLEAMERVLFKSWFVDFDPVRAKADGRQPSGIGMRIAKLFPNKFEESELGDIPKSWHVMSLDAIADFRNGLALQRFRPDEGEERLPVIKIAQLRTGEADSGEWSRAEIDPACIIDNGDVIFSWSGSLAVVVWCGGRGALNQHLFRVTSRKVSKWFYLGWLQHHLPEFQRIASDKATTMGHIQRHHLSEAKCVVPPRAVLDRAAMLLEPLLLRRIENQLESRCLSRLRDDLLPRLLSGQLPIPDAERIVEAHT